MTAASPHNDAVILQQLKRRTLPTAAIWLISIVTLFLILQQFAWPGESTALFWLAATLLLATYNFSALWLNISSNRHSERGVLLPTFGLGNALSLWRGLAIAMVGGFLVGGQPAGFIGWLPAILYTAADIADYFDGYLARITDHTTALGELLDMEYDGRGMLIVSLLAVAYGQLPWWYLLLGLARYFFLLGLAWRQWRGLPVAELHPSVHRRVFAGFQMGFMSVVLWPIVEPAGATIAGIMFAIPTALGFIRDWLVVSCRLEPTSPSYRTVIRRIYRLATRPFPILLRFLFVIGAGAVLAAAGPDYLAPAGWTHLFLTWGFGTFALPFAALNILVLFIGTFNMTIGFMGRLSSIILLFPFGFDFIVNGATWGNGIGLATNIGIMLLGTGLLSLAKPEDPLLWRRAGE